jgi:hypothetical protein
MAQSNLAKEKAATAAANSKKYEEMTEAHEKSAADAIKKADAEIAKSEAEFAAYVA